MRQAKHITSIKFIFSGTAYQTNASGDIVRTPITDQTLLQTEAQLLNLTNLSALSLVYHLDGGYPNGDTVEVISNATAQTLATEFGFFYGSQLPGETNAMGEPANLLGRYSVTNASMSEQRRVDQIYNFANSLYTYHNSGSLGGSFYLQTISGRFQRRHQSDSLTARFSEGRLIPTGTNLAPILCAGHFTLGQPIPQASIPAVRGP